MTLAVANAVKGLAAPCASQVIDLALYLLRVRFPPCHPAGVGAELFRSLMRCLLNRRSALLTNSILSDWVPAAVRLNRIDGNARQCRYPLISHIIISKFIYFLGFIPCHVVASRLRTPVLITQWRQKCRLAEKSKNNLLITQPPVEGKTSCLQPSQNKKGTFERKK